jgi:ACS family D-galactonate transporter-like MFS transporter
MSRWGLTLLLALAVMIAYVDRTNISFALASPDFRSFFHLTDYQRGVVNSSFFWTYTAMQIPMGLLVDRFGVRIPLAVGLALWCLVAAATSMTASFWQLLACRMVLGIGESVLWPAGFSWLRNNIVEKDRGLAVGIFVSGSKWGPAAASLMASRLISNYGWREMFMVLGLGGAMWLVPWLMFARDTPRTRETHAEPDEVPLAYLIRTRQIWGTLIGTFCYNYFLFYALTWMPAYFVERRNLTLNSMGVYSFLSFAGSAGVGIGAGWIADRLIRRGRDAVQVRRWFAVAGLVCASTEVIGAMSPSNNVALFFALFSLIGLGLATANYWALTQTLVPGRGGGRVAALQNTALTLAGIVAPVVTGWLKEVSGGYQAPMQAIWIVVVVGIFAYAVLIRERVPWPAKETVPV